MVNSSPPTAPYLYVNESGQHWFRWWLVTYSMPSHYLNQCWILLNWNLRNKLQWNFDQNTKIFIHKNKWKCHLQHGGQKKMSYYMHMGECHSERDNDDGDWWICTPAMLRGISTQWMNQVWQSRKFHYALTMGQMLIVSELLYVLECRSEYSRVLFCFVMFWFVRVSFH